LSAVSFKIGPRFERYGEFLTFRVDKDKAWEKETFGKVKNDLVQKGGGDEKSSWAHFASKECSWAEPYRPNIFKTPCAAAPANLALHALSMFVLRARGGRSGRRTNIALLSFPAASLPREQYRISKGSHIIKVLENSHRDIKITSECALEIEKRLKLRNCEVVRFTKDELLPLYQLAVKCNMIQGKYAEDAKSIFEQRP
jgi:hypothetical protein